MTELTQGHWLQNTFRPVVHKHIHCMNAIGRPTIIINNRYIDTKRSIAGVRQYNVWIIELSIFKKKVYVHLTVYWIKHSVVIFSSSQLRLIKSLNKWYRALSIVGLFQAKQFINKESYELNWSYRTAIHTHKHREAYTHNAHSLPVECLHDTKIHLENNHQRMCSQR